jgi:hypothetical protein
LASTGSRFSFLPASVCDYCVDGVEDEEMNLDKWIDRFNNDKVNNLSLSEQEELKSLLISLRHCREREDKELEERSLEIERDDWEREE